mmetsp:Transcript_34488/g.25581  ORF Transcript_34488/g.25581 Transcript_34488/m.25581 type:complete len:101 (+) Transcript_34488:488-790(+)
MKIRNIETRRQITFWKEFFTHLGSIENQAEKDSKLKLFEPVVLELLRAILFIVEADLDTFKEFNKLNRSDDSFDEFFSVRKDFGKLIQYVCKCCGSAQVF